MSDLLAASDQQIAAEVAGEEPTALASVDWLLALIERGGTLSAGEYERRFSSDFKEHVPLPVAQETFQKFAAELPPIAVKSRTDSPPAAAIAVLETADGPQRLDVIMTEDVPRKINGVAIQPIYEPPASYDEARAMLQRSGAKSSLLVAEVVNGQCVAKEKLAEQEPLAVGSAHALWVLLALDTKLRSTGVKAWDRKLVVKEDLKSFLGGETFDMEPGSELSVRQAATTMVAQGDNTATDHLVAFIGRENVERALRDGKHARPEANIPWLTTRELFVLKLDNDEAELARFRAAPVAEKRKLLAGLAGRPLDFRKAESWTAPRSIDIEWHASALDVCNVLATLGARARFDPQSELLKTLAQDSGISVQEGEYKYVGYKGGTEPGVVNMSWLVQRTDGRWFVVVTTVNDPTRHVKQLTVISAAEGVMKLMKDAD